jgi:hypothetical protein
MVRPPVGSGRQLKVDVPHEQHRVVVFGVVSIASASVPRDDVKLLFVVVFPIKGSTSDDSEGTNKGPSWLLSYHLPHYKTNPPPQSVPMLGSFRDSHIAASHIVRP